MADKEMIQEKIGEALGLEKAAQKAVGNYLRSRTFLYRSDESSGLVGIPTILSFTIFTPSPEGI